MTKYERIVASLPTTALIVNDSKIAYIDEAGSLRVAMSGVAPNLFPRFAEWIADLASESGQ